MSSWFFKDKLKLDISCFVLKNSLAQNFIPVSKMQFFGSKVLKRSETQTPIWRYHLYSGMYDGFNLLSPGYKKSLWKCLQLVHVFEWTCTETHRPSCNMSWGASISGQLNVFIIPLTGFFFTCMQILVERVRKTFVKNGWNNCKNEKWNPAPLCETTS